ncbi:hypothetical protein ACJIZ3_006522 [Penstemon smallii]|uniref:Uncharacterized protein n=1 Tax=Penstemon smallii TaxID=265156 RepID=A0ABD3S829_9LAMI
MDVFRCSSGFNLTRPHRPHRIPLRQRIISVRSSYSLPFAEEKAKYYEHLQAAVDVVERACRLCVDVITSFYFYI